MSTNYIGADVDCKMTELAVERNGKIVMRDRVPTDIRSLNRFLGAISGSKVMAIEEGPMAGWLYRNLKSRVDEFIICDPRRNKLISCDGDKDDAIDAGNLAALLRGGYLRKVYHTDDEDRLALKEIVALYHDRVRECVRQINKLRGCCRAYGVSIPAGAFKNEMARKEWINDLLPSVLARQISILWLGYSVVAKQVRMAREEVARRSRVYSIIGFWEDLPGVGPIRAATLFAYLDTPWRFEAPKKLWKYCGIGLKRFASGSDKDGQPKPGRLRLCRGINSKLKDAIMGAAINAIAQSKNPFAYHYKTMIHSGVTAGNARHTVARKMLTVMWGMWKTNSRYEESLV